MQYSLLLRLLRRIYQVLLYAYPTDFRRRYGPEMIQVFRDRSRSMARASGLRGLLRFSIYIWADWLITTIRERIASTHAPVEASVAAVQATGGVPGFYTSESFVPRRSALICGGILTLATFNAVSSAIEHGGGLRTFLMPLGGSHATSQPKLLETGESGFWAFGRSVAASADGVLVVLFQNQAATAGNSMKHDRVKPNGLWSNLLWLVHVRPHFPSRSGEFFLATPSALQSGKSEEARTDISNALISQFDKSDVLGLGEMHWTREDHDLRMKLVHHPDFPKKVHYIVMECGNSLHQEILDRYIRGEDVSQQEVQDVWRDITSPGGCDSPVYEQFLSEVRSINRGLPNTQAIRVLAGQPPIDWAKVKNHEEVASIAATGDEFAAKLIAREVLRKGQKAVVIFGAGHFWRNTSSVPGIPAGSTLGPLIDKAFPGRLYTVVPIPGGIYPDTLKLEALVAEC